MQKEVSALYRAAIWKDTASLAVLDTSALVRELVRRHALSGCAAQALARAVTCAAYLCGWLEDDERCSLVINGNGPLGKLHAFGDGRLRLCGSAERAAEGCRTLEEAVGQEGYLSVVRDGGTGLPFSGTCALRCGDIAGDVAAYFAESEQRPTAVMLFEKEGYCGGVFVQPLTGADESVLLRAQEYVKKCNAGMTAEDILSLFGASNAERREISFACTCSREKAARAIVSVGIEGARAVLAQEGRVSVHCHECNTTYEFDEEELEALFSDGKKRRS